MLSAPAPRVLQLLLPILLIAGQAAPKGIVLCVATDSHRQIEAVASTRCHPDSPTVGLTSAPDDDCRRDCRDTPLHQGAALRAASGSDVTPVTDSPAVAGFSMAGLDTAATRILPIPRRFSPDPSARLRSTVLLC
jgi:hypothetical protein